MCFVNHNDCKTEDTSNQTRLNNYRDLSRENASNALSSSESCSREVSERTEREVVLNSK